MWGGDYFGPGYFLRGLSLGFLIFSLVQPWIFFSHIHVYKNKQKVYYISVNTDLEITMKLIKSLV